MEFIFLSLHVTIKWCIAHCAMLRIHLWNVNDLSPMLFTCYPSTEFIIKFGAKITVHRICRRNRIFLTNFHCILIMAQCSSCSYDFFNSNQISIHVNIRMKNSINNSYQHGKKQIDWLPIITFWFWHNNPVVYDQLFVIMTPFGHT